MIKSLGVLEKKTSHINNVFFKGLFLLINSALARTKVRMDFKSAGLANEQVGNFIVQTSRKDNHIDLLFIEINSTQRISISTSLFPF